MERERRAAVILCGGKSSRMGLPKAWLPFGDELMLQRVVRLAGEAVARRVVVAAPDQELPPLPSDVTIVRDEREGRGPLEGIYAGLNALQQSADAAYITGCDVPLLAPAFMERMFAELKDDSICVPREEQFHHPLAAVYRTSILDALGSLLAANQLRPLFLFDRVPTKRIDIEDLRQADPTLATLRNLNRPEDYFAAARDAGVIIPADIERALREIRCN